MQMFTFYKDCEQSSKVIHNACNLLKTHKIKYEFFKIEGSLHYAMVLHTNNFYAGYDEKSKQGNKALFIDTKSYNDLIKYCRKCDRREVVCFSQKQADNYTTKLMCSLEYKTNEIKFYNIDHLTFNLKKSIKDLMNVSLVEIEQDPTGYHLEFSIGDYGTFYEWIDRDGKVEAMYSAYDDQESEILQALEKSGINCNDKSLIESLIYEILQDYLNKNLTNKILKEIRANADKYFNLSYGD